MRAERDFAPETLPWIDRPSANLGDCPTGTREVLQQWRDLGYVILKNAIPARSIDRYVAELGELFRDHQRFPAWINSEAHGMVPISSLRRDELEERHMRLLDFHHLSLTAKELILATPIVDFLHEVFRDTIVAMQTLTFKHGSEQSVHQDYAYVVSGIPSHLAASWIALEDAHPDAGPLAYYPGSHRIPKFDFGNGLFLTPESPLREAQFAEHIVAECADRNLPRQIFLPRKGDVLIWHAALAHEGSLVRNPALTRRSLVAHYSTTTAYPRERRCPEETVRVFRRNQAVLYRNAAPQSFENSFRRGRSIAPFWAFLGKMVGDYFPTE